MRYVKARVKTENELKTYRVYISDAVKLMTYNTARSVNDGRYLTVRYIDIIGNKPVEEDNSEDIIAGIRYKLQKLG